MSLAQHTALTEGGCLSYLSNKGSARRDASEYRASERSSEMGRCTEMRGKRLTGVSYRTSCCFLFPSFCDCGVPKHVSHLNRYTVMSTSPTSSTPGRRTSNADEKTTAEKLAHKRSLDRKAQQAARSRTKWTIENLQFQVAQLNNVLANETTRFQSLLDEAHAETTALRTENEALKTQLETAIREHAAPMDHGPSSRSMDSPLQVALLPYEAVPWNTTPGCLSDRILQTYATAARIRVHATSDIFLEESPDLTALLAQERSTNPSGVSSVVSDVLLAYKEINTLPKKAACLYVMYKLLNVRHLEQHSIAGGLANWGQWFIYRTQLTYDQMPRWLAPVPLQLRSKHAAWIDRIPWPSARIYLIRHPEITFDEFVKYYSSSFDVSWPYDDEFVLITAPPKSPTTDSAFNTWFIPNDNITNINLPPAETPILNPVFEQHLRQLKNWRVSSTFTDRFPELSAAMIDDSRHDWGDSRSKRNP